jgi:DNA-binding NarL/FixJ family response regulator
MNKKVAVVEDNPALREQLVQILSRAPDIRCVGAFATAEEALKQIPSRNPDVVLMDIKLPGMSGIECIAELKSFMPELQIIMVTVYEDSESIFRALKAGANGYLVKSGPPKQLLEAVRDVHRGGSPMSSHIARKVVQHFQRVGPSAAEGENLSHREQQVLELLSSGFLYKEIGDKLQIGVETVRTYVKSICQKMHVRNRLEAVAKRRPTNWAADSNDRPRRFKATTDRA